MTNNVSTTTSTTHRCHRHLHIATAVRRCCCRLRRASASISPRRISPARSVQAPGARSHVRKWPTLCNGRRHNRNHHRSRRGRRQHGEGGRRWSSSDGGKGCKAATTTKRQRSAFHFECRCYDADYHNGGVLRAVHIADYYNKRNSTNSTY